MVLLANVSSRVALLSKLCTLADSTPTLEMAHATVSAILGPNTKDILARNSIYHKAFLLHLPGNKF
jgi:hypothetical protein